MNIGLVLDIALGIVTAEILTAVWNWLCGIGRPARWPSERTAVQQTFERIDQKKAQALPHDEGEREDWIYLWSTVPDNVRDQARQFIEADRLRLRAKRPGMDFLWPLLWKAAPEHARQELRARWEDARIDKVSDA